MAGFVASSPLPSALSAWRLVRLVCEWFPFLAMLPLAALQVRRLEAVPALAAWSFPCPAASLAAWARLAQRRASIRWAHPAVLELKVERELMVSKAVLARPGRKAVRRQDAAEHRE